MSQRVTTVCDYCGAGIPHEGKRVVVNFKTPGAVIVVGPDQHPFGKDGPVDFSGRDLDYCGWACVARYCESLLERTP